MPIYEYHCAECGVEFEKFIVSGQAIVECPSCRSRAARRKLSLFSLRSPSAPVASAGGGGGCCAAGGCSCH